MSIFSRKSKPKEAEEKAKKPPTNATNGVKPEQPRVSQKPQIDASSTLHKDGTPISPAERTAQRAALMAASRKTMNMGDVNCTTNGSMTSASKGRTSHVPSDAARPVKVSDKGAPRSKSVKTPHKTLVKSQKSSEDTLKKQGNTDSSSRGIESTPDKPHRSAPGSIRGDIDEEWAKMGLFGDPVLKKVPAPMHSPTLGYTPRKSMSKEVDPARSQPSADSGYGSVARSSANNSRTGGESIAAQDATPRDVPRVDSGIVPKSGLGKEAGMSSPARRNQYEDKSLLSPATTIQSKVPGYVSRLDPGPTGSDFGSSVGSSTSSADRRKMQNPTATTPAPGRPSQPEVTKDRGRSTAQKPAYSTAPSSPTLSSPQPPYARPSRSQSSSSRSRSEMRSSDSQTRIAESASASKYGSPHMQTAQVMYASSKSRPSKVEPQPQASRRESGPAFEPPRSRFADGTTLNALQANGSAVPTTKKLETRKSQPVSNHEPSSKQAPPPAHSFAVQPPNHQQAGSIASVASTRRSTLPPVSALEGYRVNKRGQVLDEEGDAVGELFEGDLIDCVRQKVSADGEVLDEFGEVVGRVRPIRRSGNDSRYSQDNHSAGRRSSIVARPIGSATSGDRRPSNASSMISPLTSTNIGQSKSLSRAMTAQQVITPLDAQGNAFVAELDASTEAEAFPVMDHSDIFLPTFGSSTRNQSPSQLMKPELPANGRRQSVSSNASQDVSVISAVEPKPKRWASRYFEQVPQAPGSPTTAPRRNSQSPAASRTALKTTSQSQPVSRRSSQVAVVSPVARADTVSSPRSVSSPNGWGQSGAFKAILGPTLEDLAEETPSRSLSRTSQAGKSTPNLLSEASRLNVPPQTQNSPTGSRRASLQAGSSLGPQSIRASYQPIRRSPLGNYETTPPGSGDANGRVNSPARSVSARASASVPQDVSQDPEDADDSAPAPDIPKAKARARSGNRAEKVKQGDRRKSIFNFMSK